MRSWKKPASRTSAVSRLQISEEYYSPQNSASGRTVYFCDTRGALLSSSVAILLLLGSMSVSPGVSEAQALVQGSSPQVPVQLILTDEAILELCEPKKTCLAR